MIGNPGRKIIPKKILKNRPGYAMPRSMRVSIPDIGKEKMTDRQAVSLIRYHAMRGNPECIDMMHRIDIANAGYMDMPSAWDIHLLAGKLSPVPKIEKSLSEKSLSISEKNQKPKSVSENTARDMAMANEDYLGLSESDHNPMPYTMDRADRCCPYQYRDYYVATKSYSRKGHKVSKISQFRDRSTCHGDCDSCRHNYESRGGFVIEK